MMQKEKKEIAELMSHRGQKPSDQLIKTPWKYIFSGEVQISEWWQNLRLYLATTCSIKSSDASNVI